MRMENSYQRALDEAFAAHFPQWTETSPFDPMKVFGEALALATSEIERRQSRFIDTLLDSMPSLFSFDPKPAEAARLLFRLPPSPSLNEPRWLSAPQGFRLPNGETYLLPKGDLLVFPVRLGDVRREANAILIDLFTPCALSELRLFFSPQSVNAAPHRLTDITWRAEAGGKTHTFFTEQLEITDGTEGFTAPGHWTLRPAPGADAYLTSQPGRVTLRLDFTQTAPEGELAVNVFEGSLVRFDEEVKLGSLAGDPWETISLPATALFPPETLTLQYPDDRTQVIHRLSSDLLKLKHSDADRFANAFFHDAANHRLIVPGAPQLLRDYTGGVTVSAKRMVGASADELPKGKISPGELAAAVESVIPLRFVSSFIPRESKVDYLKRFYSAMRLFTAAQIPQPGIFRTDIEQLVLGSHPLLERVELTVDAAEKNLTVYVLTAPDARGLRPLTAETREKVGEVLSRVVPLDYRWTVRPFEVVPFQVVLELKANIEDERLGSVTEATVTAALGEIVPAVFQSRAWTADARWDLSQLGEMIHRRLTQTTEDHSSFEPAELSPLKLLVLHGPSGAYVSEITRKAGQWLVPTVTTSVQFIRFGAEVSVG
jgi:hypothetical protein